MVEVLPAILTSDPKEFAKKCEQVGMAPAIHVDITDSSVVPKPSMTLKELQSCALSFPIELHLMVQDPDVILTTLMASQVRRVTIHVHSVANLAATLVTIRNSGREAGVVLGREEINFDLSAVEPLLSQITVLTVPPGVQGSTLDPDMLTLARTLRSRYPHIPIEVDGGIKLENIGEVVTVAADRYVVGSGIWQSDNPTETYQQFQKLLAHP